MDLVERVKVLQKGECRESWAIYCDTYGSGTRDPGRHSEAFLTGFIDYIQDGTADAYGLSVMPDHVTEVKALQRQGFRGDWAMYCDKYGCGVRDPKRQDASFCKRFSDGCRNGSLQQLFLQLQKQNGQYQPQCGIMGFSVAPSISVFQPTPVNVVMASGAYGNAYSVETPQPDLVKQVKEMQRAGYREAWAQFCQNSGNKTRDPARYDGAFLAAFTNYIHNGSLPAENGSSMRLPNSMEFPSCQLPGPIMRNEGACQLPDSIVGRTSSSQQLVDKVKNLQRSGLRQNWSLYCDQFGQRVRDPSRHSDEFLQFFVDNPIEPWTPPKFVMMPHMHVPQVLARDFSLDMLTQSRGAVDGSSSIAQPSIFHPHLHCFN